jgi:hypothetical protein
MSDPAGNGDQELLRRALEGDEPALVALFDGSRDRLRKMIRLRLGAEIVGLDKVAEIHDEEGAALRAFAQA